MVNKKFLSILICLVMGMVLLSGCSLFPSLSDVKPGNPSMELPAKDSLLAKYIPSQVILKTTDKEALNKVLADFKGTIVKEISKLNAYKINIDITKKGSLVDTIKAIRKYSKIEYAEPVYVYKASGSPVTPTDSEYATRQWGPKAVGIEEGLGIAYNRGNGVVIGIVDTGVDYNHPELAGRVLPGYNVYTGESGLDATMDVFGHGTHVSGIAAANLNAGQIVGIAPEAIILPVKVLDDDGYGTSEGIAYGITWAVDNGAKVINLSLGGWGYSQILQEAINYAVAENVPVIVAMGNDGKNYIEYPAACPGAIAIGATDGNMNVAGFSSRGKHISIAAPGVDIYSSLPDGQYATWNGTSMATPFVTGAVALLLGQEPGLTVSQIKSRLEGSVIDVGAPGFDEETGYGFLNLPAFLTQNVNDVYGSIRVYAEFSQVPAANVDILLCDANDKTVKDIRTNDNGLAFFNNTKEGTYSLKVILGDRKIVKNNIVVTAGSVTNVDLVETVPTSIMGYVAEARGGAGISGVDVSVIGSTSTYSLTTDENGNFYAEIPAGTYEVLCNKDGWAGSRYQEVTLTNNRMTTVNIIERQAFSSSYSTVPPTISLSGLQPGAYVAGTVNFTVNLTGPNAIKEIGVRFGNFTLSPEQYVVDQNSLDVTFDTTQKSDGQSFIDVIGYDVNYNVVEWVIPIVISNGSGAGEVPGEAGLSVQAMTFGQNLGIFKEKRTQMFQKMHMKGDPNIIRVNGKEYNLKQFPENRSIFVALFFDAYNATGYKVYRSMMPTGPFKQIADVNTTSYYDGDPVLKADMVYYYKVIPYNNNGDGPESPVIWAKPMGVFNVYLESPMNDSTVNSLQPTFTWSTTPIDADLTEFQIYVAGTTDSYPLADMYVNDTDHVIYNGEALAPGKEYRWDVYLADAVNIYSDYSVAVSFSGTNEGSVNGEFLFTTDVNATLPGQNLIMQMDINEPDGTTDYIPIEITENGIYTFETSYTSADCDTELTLYDEAGNILAYSDDADGRFSRFTIELTPGVYYVIVNEYYGYSLACRLAVYQLQ